MFPPPARGAGKKRKQPTASSSSGGINLLDSIMGGMTKTMDRLPARKPGQGSSAIAQEDFQEVASHYMMAARPAQGTDPPDKNICKNPECGGRDFNVDMRRGDKICNSCGAVQNARSLEDYSEEKRTFADDDKKQDKQRAERNGDGKASTRAGGQHAQAEKLAMKVGADGGDGISPQDEARIEKYKEAVQHLGQQLTLPQQRQVKPGAAPSLKGQAPAETAELASVARGQPSPGGPADASEGSVLPSPEVLA